MKYKIHYTIDNYEDYYILEGNTIDEIIELNNLEMEKRKLDEVKNNCWSEED